MIRMMRHRGFLDKTTPPTESCIKDSVSPVGDCLLHYLDNITHSKYSSHGGRFKGDDGFCQGCIPFIVFVCARCCNVDEDLHNGHTRGRIQLTEVEMV